MTNDSDDLLPMLRDSQRLRERKQRVSGWLIALVVSLVLAIAAATDLPRIIAYIIGGG